MNFSLLPRPKPCRMGPVSVSEASSILCFESHRLHFCSSPFSCRGEIPHRLRPHHGRTPRRPRGAHGSRPPASRPERQGGGEYLRQSHAVRSEGGLFALSPPLSRRSQAVRGAWGGSPLP